MLAVFQMNSAGLSTEIVLAPGSTHHAPRVTTAPCRPFLFWSDKHLYHFLIYLRYFAISMLDWTQNKKHLGAPSVRKAPQKDLCLASFRIVVSQSDARCCISGHKRIKVQFKRLFLIKK